MAASGIELRPSIDRPWLDAALRAEPILHAFAVWDLDQFPGRVRFVSAIRDGTPVGYLLLWPLPEGGHVVHWLGDPAATELLLDGLPPRPMVVVGPEGGARAVDVRRGPVVAGAVLAEMAPPGVPPAPGDQDPNVRRLTADDRALLRAFAREQPERIGTGYAELDPGREPIWGGFDRSRLVALARPAVRLPEVWVVSGVFVTPDRRNEGWGRAVVRAVMADAARAGAPCGLFVHEESAAARAVYRGLGFRVLAKRAWIDAGLGREP